jgi:hypothetical protein
MKLGMTGNRHGISALAMHTLQNYLSEHHITEVHHGDCRGADEDFHNVVTEKGIRTVIHPPDNSTMRAHCKGSEILNPKPYIRRNHDIVDASEILIAFPSTKKEIQRSGTWATVRYARKQKKQVILIYPDG